MCTLRNFPHLIDHCIEWSRAQFTEVFEDPAKELKKLLEDKAGFMAVLEKEGNTSVQLDKLTMIKNLVQYLNKVCHLVHVYVTGKAYFRGLH